jgi:hypothetical protein
MDEHQMKDAALMLALEALEYPGPSWIEARQPAITAIKQALEQPEPEPVAWLYESVCGKDFAACNYPPNYAKNIRPLYTFPPKRKPLTDEQIDALPFPPSGTATLRDFVRIIESAHGIFANAHNKGEA